MTALTRSFRRKLRRRDRTATESREQTPPSPDPMPEQAPVEIGPNDPLIAYFQSASGAVDVDELELDSAALRDLKAAGVKLAVPLVSQGELIGVLNLGPRLFLAAVAGAEVHLLVVALGHRHADRNRRGFRLRADRSLRIDELLLVVLGLGHVVLGIG